MERELRIVISLFLVYLLYGFASLFQTGVLVTPIFLTPFVLIASAFSFALMNRKLPHVRLLFFSAIAFLFFALADEFIISLLTRAAGQKTGDFLHSRACGIVTFMLFFAYLFYSIWFLYRTTGQKLVAGVLFCILSACITSFFTDYYLFQEISIQFFCLFYFAVGQSGHHLENKVLRVISYQFLLFSLLEAFEYFL